MHNAVITGSAERARAVTAALQGHGFETLVADASAIAEVATRTPQGSVGCYVQLPIESDSDSSLARSLGGRVEAVAAVVPLLACNATVLIVADDAIDPASRPRVSNALRSLVQALADSEAPGVTVTIVEPASLPSTIAAALLRDSPAGSLAPLAAHASRLAYADWRTDVLNLTSVTDATYFGWVNRHGDRRVGILRRAVVTPLSTPPDAAVSWGDCGAGAHILGRALFREALGGTGRCPVCQPGADCVTCAGSGLRGWADELVEGFVKEVIDSLPAGGFELPAADVDQWISRRRIERAAAHPFPA
jgi:hypothetical protein